MTMKEFQKFIDEQDALLRSKMHPEHTEREWVLAGTVKIAEEFGELSDEVLASMNYQRSGKMNGRSSESLADEFADVVITAFLLAKRMDIDIMKAIARKVPLIKEKHNKQLRS